MLNKVTIDEWSSLGRRKGFSAISTVKKKLAIGPPSVDDEKMRRLLMKKIHVFQILFCVIFAINSSLVSASAENEYCSAYYKYNSLITVLAGSYATSDGSRRAIMLENAQSFSDEIVRMYSEGSFDSLDGSERDAIEKYSRMISEKDQSFNAEFRYFQIENDIEKLILDLNSEAKWSGFAEELDESNYFERMSSESKAGLQTLIAHIGIEALRYHPWLAIPADDEELLEAQVSCFFYGIDRLASKLNLKSPTVNKFAYESNGRLILELDEVKHTVLDEPDFGENASYHVGANILKYLSGWLEENGKDEVLYSLADWNDHVAIVFTRDQFSVVAQSADLGDLEIPRIREK